MLKQPFSSWPRSAYGDSLVEVLVAVVVISIGLLGMASLYVTALDAKITSQSRTQAVNLATDIAERIRANRQAGTAYDTTITVPKDNGCVDSVATKTTVANNCNTNLLAADDLFKWTTDIARLLPGTPAGTVTAAQIVAPPNAAFTYTIVLTWNEPTTGNQSYSLQMRVQI